MPEPTRKLAAIVFTDIAGFTALSAKDEKRAFRLIESQRSILKPIVISHGGKWLKEIGDGLLLSFPSSIEAVNCAIELQQAVKIVENLNIRIGIHQGDILEEEGEIYGDDVNIASRIEPFAAIGGIAISQKVQSDISGSPELSTKYIGIPKLKGVRQRVEVYCLTSHGLPATKPSEVTAKLEKRPTVWIKWAVPAVLIAALASYYLIPKVQDVPSLGILYIENLGAEEDEFWARGITEDVIIEVESAGLIRVAPIRDILEFRGSHLALADIAKRIRVKYLLTSSIQKNQNIFNMRVHLIQAQSGKTLYADSWSEPLTRASTLTGTIARNILTTLGVSTIKSFTKPPTNYVEPYEFYMRGKYKWAKRKNKEDVEIARALLQKAIQLDPNLLLAKLELGQTYRGTGDYDKALEIFRECQYRSEKIGDRAIETFAVSNLGNIHLAQGSYDAALEYYQQSLTIARELGDKFNEKAILLNTGSVHYGKGEYDQALLYYTKSLNIASDLGDQRGEGEAYYTLGMIHDEKADYYQALDSYRRSLELFRNIGEKNRELYPLIGIGLIYTRNGNRDEAFENLNLSLQIAREVGDKHSEIYALIYIGDLYYQMMQNERALQYYQRSLERAKSIGDRYIEGLAYQNLGSLMVQEGKYDESLYYFNSACDIWLELDDIPNYLWSLSWWTLSETKTGNIAKGEVKTRELEKVLESTNPNHEDVITVHWNISQIYSALEQNKQSVRHLQIAYDELMDQAGRFIDPKDTETYLNNIRENRDIINAHQKLIILDN